MADFRFTALEKPFIKGWGYCEGMPFGKGGKGCLEYTPNQYKRTSREAKGMHPLSTIHLCDECARDRIPYTIEEANFINDQIKGEYLQQAS